MSSIAVFTFNCNSIRVVMQDGEPWFVAKDVCAVLEVKNVSDALSRLDDDEKQLLPYDRVIGLTDDPDTTRLLAVSESGLYALVLSSRKPEARPFQRWVTKEVLPTIRKTGIYSIATSTFIDHRLDPDWQKERATGKRKRLTMTDATATWIERREKEQGRRFKQWEKNKIYAAHSDALNVGVYGRKAKDLRDTLGIAKNRLLRDYFSSDEIAALQTVEEAAAWFVLSKDMHPAEAIAKVVELIEYSRRFAERHHEPTALKGTGKVKTPKQLPPDNGQLSLF